MASSLRSRGGGSGRRVFINGIRGIIDGVPRVGRGCVRVTEGRRKSTFVDARRPYPSDTFNQLDWSRSYTGSRVPSIVFIILVPTSSSDVRHACACYADCFGLEVRFYCIYIYIYLAPRRVSFIESIFLFNFFITFLLSFIIVYKFRTNVNDKLWNIDRSLIINRSKLY